MNGGRWAHTAWVCVCLCKRSETMTARGKIENGKREEEKEIRGKMREGGKRKRSRRREEAEEEEKVKKQ